jgi:hypothetical protein
VAGGAVDEEHREPQPDPRPRPEVERPGEAEDGEDGGGGEGRTPGLAREGQRAGEAENERGEVRRERQHPQQGDRRDLLREVARHGEQQQRGHGRQPEPEQALAPGADRRPGSEGGGPGRRVRGRGGRRGHAAGDRRAGRHQRGVDGERPRPQPALLRQPQVTLDEPGVAQEAQERAAVREGEEPERRGLRAHPGEPGLEQRAGGGEGDEGQADHGGEPAQHRADRRLRRDRPPRVARGERRGPVEPAPGDERQREAHEREVQVPLPPRGEAIGEEVGPRVAGEERGLEEQQAGRPEGRGAAEPREESLAEHQLHLEQQQRAEAGGGGEGKHRDRRLLGACRLRVAHGGA